MIKNTDVRIGNLILGVSDRVEKVVAIGENYCYTQISTMPSHTQEWVDVNGIPLTEDWLLKAGAIRRHGQTYFIDKLKFSYENNELSEFVRFNYSGKVTYLKYVHQLQNLFWILTGQELQLTT